MYAYQYHALNACSVSLFLFSFGFVSGYFLLVALVTNFN